MEVGQRVVRGESWNWGNQDGGEGNVGTVVVIGQHGSTSSPDKTVIVQWDTGGRTNYRCGHENAYDLLLLDNGPIGISHDRPCSQCKSQKVNGMLWSCSECNHCYLCSTCYSNEKHSLDHQFYRIDTPTSIPVMVSKRRGKNKLYFSGTFRGAVVKRGPDWDWCDQDGGENQRGLVTDVKGWDDQTYQSVVSVSWSNCAGNVYRRGHKGKVDVISTTTSIGGHYYKEHLPKLGFSYAGSKSPISQTTTKQTKPPSHYPPQHGFKPGDEVWIVLDEDILKTLQKDYGGCSERMLMIIGAVGVVQSIFTKNNGVVVKFPLCDSDVKVIVNPLALSKAERFDVNDKVRVLNDLRLVKKLQTGHGEWGDAMLQILGQEGTVMKVYSDGDVRVSTAQSTWTLNPAVLTKIKQSSQPLSPQQTASMTAGFRSLSIKDAGLQLVTASREGNCGRVRELLAKNPTMVNSQSQCKTALHLSSLQGHGDIVKLLLDAGANSDMQDENGDSALHHAVKGKSLEVVVLLVQYQANLNVMNNAGHTPLYRAVCSGLTGVVQVLVNAGCNLNVQEPSGDTPLHVAVNKDMNDIMDILIDSNQFDLTLVNHRGFTVFHTAALKGRQRFVKKLLQKEPLLLNSAKDDGFTALHLASVNGHIGLVRYLLSKDGCQVNYVNLKNQTALLLAVDTSRKDIVKVLLEHGANPNLQDDVGDTPLHTAAVGHCSHDNPGDWSIIISLLLEYGADRNLRNHDNRTAIELSDELGLFVTQFSLPQEPIPLPQTRLPQEVTSSVTMTTSDQCKAEITNIKENNVLEECQVCCEAPANVTFEPCLHKVVCSDCCVRMKKCFVCQVTIQTKNTTDGSQVCQEKDKVDVHEAMNSLAYLQSKVQEMEDAHNCAICMENQRTVVFLCGHSTCDVCCQSLQDCPMCRKPIEKKIKLYS